MTQHRRYGILSLFCGPGDPLELELEKPGGQWLELRGNKEQRREQIGNAVPPATAQAIAEQVLELLDGAGSRTFKLSSAGVWVAPGARRGRCAVLPSALEAT